MTLVVNLFGGPGTGKSTTMSGLFAELKWRGINCEQSHEFAKEKVWEDSTAVLEDQIYVFGKQAHNLHRLESKVDVIITDSPLLLSLVYGEHESNEFKALVKEVHDRYDNLNIFLRRLKSYNPAGRLQTEMKARELDEKIEKMLIGTNTVFEYHDAAPETIVTVAQLVEQYLQGQEETSQDSSGGRAHR